VEVLVVESFDGGSFAAGGLRVARHLVEAPARGLKPCWARLADLGLRAGLGGGILWLAS